MSVQSFGFVGGLLCHDVHSRFVLIVVLILAHDEFQNRETIVAARDRCWQSRR